MDGIFLVVVVVIRFLEARNSVIALAKVLAFDGSIGFA